MPSPTAIPAESADVPREAGLAEGRSDALRGAGGVPKDPVRTAGSAKPACRLCEVLAPAPLARRLRLAAGAALAGAALASRPRRSLLGEGRAVPDRPAPPQRKESRPCRKGVGRRSTGTSPPNTGTAGQPGLRRRTACPRRGLPSPNCDRRFRRARAGLPKGVPRRPAGSWPEGQRTLVLSAWRPTGTRPVRRPKPSQNRSQISRSGTRRSPILRGCVSTRPEPGGEVPRRRCPALSRARKCSPESEGRTI